MSTGTDHTALVAVFGKHPGWDDHIDDIGLDTAALVAIKRTLYVDGIGANIDAGTWERLDDSQRLPEFGSAFVSFTANGVVAGRLWSSSDGKGRSRYPMVACAQCPAGRSVWLIEQAAPRLEDIERRCRSVRSALDVQTIVREAGESLANAVSAAGSDGSALVQSLRTGQALVRLSEKVDSECGQGAFRRVLYKIDRDMSAFLRTRKGNGRLQPAAQLVRIPAADADVAPSLAVWAALMLCLLRPGTDLLVVRSLQEPWVDLIVGPARAQQIYCLRASRKALPPATDIPYGIDSSFLQQSDKMIESWRAGSVDVLGAVAMADGTDGRSRGVAGLFRSMTSIFGR